MYGAGIFKTFNVHEASRNAFKKRYTYSQIGVKFDYFSGNLRKYSFRIHEPTD